MSHNAICPRVIIGNRGDILSRIGIVSYIKNYYDIVTVLVRSSSDINGLQVEAIEYNSCENIFPKWSVILRLLRSRHVIWTGGLDIQDTSGYLRLLYLLYTFTFYKMFGLKIIVLCQGAGPLKTKNGKVLAKLVVKLIDAVIARDENSFNLIKSLNSRLDIVLGYDGIFLSRSIVDNIDNIEKNNIDAQLSRDKHNKVIGFNIRLWYHFNSKLVPYQLSVSKGEASAKDRMNSLILSAVTLIRKLTVKYNAKVLLISAYQPDELSALDDTKWLNKIKEAFDGEDNVVLVNNDMSIEGYSYLLSKLDLVIGMRLHTVLAALRNGTPGININYTLKGRDIMNHMKLGKYVIELSDFVSDANALDGIVEEVFSDYVNIKAEIIKSVKHAIGENEKIVKGVICRYGCEDVKSA